MLVEIIKIKKEEKVIVTSLDVAETFGKRHDNIIRDIEQIKKDMSSDDIEKNSNLRTTQFDEMFCKTTYKAKNGKSNPMYHMTFDGFSLLVMGYTGKKAMKYKLAYIKEFNRMQKELENKAIQRQKSIGTRNDFTDTLKESPENDRMHGHSFSNYTNLIYKALFGKTASQLRTFFGIAKTANLRDCFTTEQLKAVENIEKMVTGFIGIGWQYDQIKEFIMKQTNTMNLLEA